MSLSLKAQMPFARKDGGIMLNATFLSMSLFGVMPDNVWRNQRSSSVVDGPEGLKRIYKPDAALPRLRRAASDRFQHPPRLAPVAPVAPLAPAAPASPDAIASDRDRSGGISSRQRAAADREWACFFEAEALPPAR